MADHVLRRHAFPLFVLTTLFIALYVVYKVVGDPVLQLVKVCRRRERSIVPSSRTQFFNLSSRAVANILNSIPRSALIGDSSWGMSFFGRGKWLTSQLQPAQ